MRRTQIRRKMTHSAQATTPAKPAPSPVPVPRALPAMLHHDGHRLVYHFHPGQLQAWNSTARFIAVLAGAQGGKTSFGPHWLLREIVRCGPGDYLIVTPS